MQIEQSLYFLIVTLLNTFDGTQAVWIQFRSYAEPPLRFLVVTLLNTFTGVQAIGVQPLSFPIGTNTSGVG